MRALWVQVGGQQLMPTKAQVASKAPVVGVEFDPSSFQVAITPEVTLPDELESLKVGSAVIGNLQITGEITGLPETPDPVVALNDLSDVSTESLVDGAGLQYDATQNQWLARLTNNPNNFTTNDLTDVDAVNPADLSILQYNTQIDKWEAVANTEFVDAVIDGGYATTPESDYVTAFDIDGGNA